MTLSADRPAGAQEPGGKQAPTADGKRYISALPAADARDRAPLPAFARS